MRYRPPDYRDMPTEEFERKARHNNYMRQIYDFPRTIIPHPSFEKFEEFWKNRCSRSNKVHVEIGCGSGGYLIQLAQNFPNDCFAGFELRYKRLVLAAKKIEKFDCANVLLLKDKGEYLGDYFGENSIDRIHVNFPDPWSKKAQKKHRLLNHDFFQKISVLLRPEGQFLFKTDHQEYFQWVLDLLKNFPNFQTIEATTHLQQSSYYETNIQTEFEKMFQFKSNPNIGYLKIQIYK
ncbi:MAG: tRNA (guanosine(46)-N7)-methyltransferase TrmB [SAR324 cluster bacterium]|nr:tRNA (guanosine(46)-N7)-methyltransferase TrmB [SAR324 cluster bacterium]